MVDDDGDRRNLAYVTCAGKPSVAVDGSVPGTYLVAFSEGVPAEFREGAALEAFHGSVSISVPGDFEIAVTDHDGKPFEGQVAGNDAPPGQSLGEWAVFLGKVEPLSAVPPHGG